MSDPQNDPHGVVSESIQLEAEDAKLVTLARAARARNAAADGAAVRDDTGRTYVATTVDLPSLQLSALRAAVVIAVASGAAGLEAAAVVTSSGLIDDGDTATVADLAAGAPIFLAGVDGLVRSTVVA